MACLCKLGMIMGQKIVAGTEEGKRKSVKNDKCSD